MIALQAGVPEDGVRWLESALEIDPHYAPAHQALAEYYKQIGDRARSAQHLSEAKSAAGRRAETVRGQAMLGKGHLASEGRR